MGVGANYDIAWVGVFLSNDLVAHSFSYLGEDGTSGLGEGAQECMVVRQLAGWAGGGVIEKEDSGIRVDQMLETTGFELSDGQRSGAILDEGQVHRRDDDISGTNIRPGFLCEDLFS